MSIFIERFNPTNLPKEQTVRFSKKGWVAIEDRENGEYICMIRIHRDYEANKELAQKIIELIESEINGAED